MSKEKNLLNLKNNLFRVRRSRRNYTSNKKRLPLKLGFRKNSGFWLVGRVKGKYFWSISSFYGVWWSYKIESCILRSWWKWSEIWVNYKVDQKPELYCLKMDQIPKKAKLIKVLFKLIHCRGCDPFEANLVQVAVIFWFWSTLILTQIQFASLS